MTVVGASLFSRTERALLTTAALALVLVAGFLALHAEVRESDSHFSADAHRAAAQVSHELVEGRTLVTALHMLFQSGTEQAEAQLPDLANRITIDYPQVKWIAYAQRVAAPERGQFEHRRRDAGYTGFSIKPFPKTTGALPATAHLPVSHIEPLTPLLARYLGADLHGPAQWQHAIAQAVDHGGVRAVATSGRYLGAPGFLILRATYLGNVAPVSVAERRQQAAGLVLAFLDRKAMLEQIELSALDAHVAFGSDAPSTTVAADRLFSAVLNPSRRRLLELPFENLMVPVQVTARLQPQLDVVLVTMLLTALFAGSGMLALSQRRHALHEERQAREQAQRAQVTLHSIGEAVVRLDDDGCVHYMNPAAEGMAGMCLAEASGRPLHDVFSLDVEGGPISARNLRRLQESDRPALLHNPTHTVLAVACTLTPLTDASGGAAGMVLIMRDVSREHALSRELAWQASHDPLTNLPNRREFERQLKGAVASAVESDSEHTLCYVDLDQFKIVNDTCGHAAGDRMLRQIAGLLGTELRDDDLLARLGGDEFGILLRDCPVNEALVIARRVCSRVSSFRFDWGGRSFDLGASIGVVAISANAGTVDDVQRAADMACYAAKEMGRNRVHLYRHEDHVINRNQREMQWHTELRRALEEGRFELHSQPIQALRTGTGVERMEELLLRLVDTDGEIVPPVVFLPAAERYGMMNLVDRMVIEKAFSQISDKARAEHLYTINLSGQSLSEGDLADFVLNAASRHRVSPRGVCFEITETAAISNFAQAVSLMQKLRREGFRFALDDFGAGVSSFGYLKQLPVDFLKIDGQFVHDISTDPVARVMVSSIISVARVLQIETVAEKVEEESARRCLIELGADYVQGYLIGRPAAMDERRAPVLAYSA